MTIYIEDFIDQNLTSGMYKLDPDVFLSYLIKLYKKIELASGN